MATRQYHKARAPTNLSKSDPNNEILGVELITVGIAGSRRILFRELTAEPPPESAWEVGASCNFMIAAARLGLRVGAVGHVGDDVYGDFMRRIMQVPLPRVCLTEQLGY